MAHLSTCLVLLSSIFLHCLASPIITSNAPYPYPGNQSSVAATGLFSSVPSQAATSSSAPYPNTSSATAGASAVVGTGTSKSSDSVVPFGTGVSTTKLVPHGTGVTPYQATNSGSSTLSGVAATGALRSNSSVPSGTEVSTSNSALAGGTASSHNVLSSPTSSLVPAFASGLAFNLSNVAYTGSFSASLTVPTEVFPSFLAPSTTVAGSAATSEAALLGALFLALQANRQWITDPKLKSQYLDNVKISRGETLAFFNDLGIKPPADPQCSDKKRKRTPSSEKKLRSLVSERNLISGFTDLVGDVAKLLSCAVQVVDNLEDAVDVPVPDLHEIETLTDTLAEIGDDLQEEEDHDNESSTSASQSGPSSTKKSSTTSSSSASSCIGRTAIPHCTETISLSTSFLNGNTASPAVSTVTSMDCTTVTGCSVTGSTAITTASVSGTSGGLVCSPSCLACADDSIPTGNATSKKFRRNELLNERTLGEPSAFSSFDNFFIRTILAEPGAIELEHRRTGTGSSALYQSWLDMPLHVYLTGLFGCTAVAIVSRQGVWIGHFWESPSFFGDDAQFQTQVIGAIINGDTSRMPSPFPLAKSGEILSSGTNVQIFISTPLDPESNNGALLYKDRVGLIESTLTGEGCPFNGVPVTTWGYVKAKNEEVDELAETARSKVLIQYDNNQVNDPPKPQQQAIWRVWLEAQMYQDEWDATDAQRAGSCANTGNQKRQAEVSCSRPAGSSLTSGEPTGFSSSAASFSGPNGSLTSAAVVSPSNGVSSAVLTSSATNSSVNQQNTLTVFHAHSDAKLPPPLTSITPSQTSSNAVPSPTFSLLCYPFQDPDAGPAPPECQCDGLDGTFPYLSSSTSQSNYNPCGFTTTPTTASTTAAAFTTTESNGNVVSCASSTYYNFAVNMVPMCAGATSVISTVASIASVYSVSTASVTSIASVSAASLSAISASAPSAAAVYASAAAVPSAGCWILSDDGYGDSSFEVYGINGWAGSEGENLFEQEEGCGILTGFRFHTDEQDEFEGQMRDTQYAYFGLSFFKGGCVERAVHSAGGPPPGTEPGHLACQHASHLSGNQSDAVGGIATAQAKAVKSVANGGSTNSSLSTSDEEKAVVDTSSSSPETMEGPQPDASLVASASAALPHLLAAQSASSNGHDRRKAG